MNDTISRQAVLALPRDRIRNMKGEIVEETINVDAIRTLPPAEPEPAIPLSWIENHIEWLKSVDNMFSTLTAMQISTMVKKWKDEQDEGNDKRPEGKE